MVSIRPISTFRKPCTHVRHRSIKTSEVDPGPSGDGELGGRENTSEKIRQAIEKAGVEFIDENGGGAGVRLRKRQKKKG